MLIDRLFSKLGMLLLLLFLFEALSKGHCMYDTYNARREAEALAKGIADDIAAAARAAPQYSVAGGHSKLITLPGSVHGMPYLLRLDAEEYLVEVVLLDARRSEEVSARAFLPAAGVETPTFAGFESSEDGSQNLLVEGRLLKLKIARGTGYLNVSVVGG